MVLYHTYVHIDLRRFIMNHQINIFSAIAPYSLCSYMKRWSFMQGEKGPFSVRTRRKIKEMPSGHSDAALHPQELHMIISEMFKDLEGQ